MPKSATLLLLYILAVLLSAGLVVHQSWEMVVEGDKPVIQGNDDTGYFIWLHSWVMDGDNDLANNLSQTHTFTEEDRAVWLERIHPYTRKALNKYPVGWAVMSWPVYQLTHYIYQAFNGGSTGFESVYFLMVWANQLILAVLSLWITFHILRRFFPPAISHWAMLVTWLSSPLVYYQTAKLSLAHNQAYFLTVLLVLISLDFENNHRWFHWLLLGTVSGLLVITRPTSIAYALIPAWSCIQQLRTDLIRHLGDLGLGILGGAVPIFLQMYVWKQVYGSWIVFSYSGEPFYFTSPALFGSLLSDRHGLFNWHPLLLAGCIGWILATVGKGKFPRAWLVGFLAIVYLNSAWWCWWFGSSFGNRAYEGAILFFMAGMAHLKVRSLNVPWQRNLLDAAVWMTVIWNVFLLWGYLTQRFDRSMPVSYWERLMGG